MKAYLVIDLPDDINVDDVGITYIVQQWSGLLVEAQVEHVPLKQMPSKKEVDFSKVMDYADGYYAEGWNACLEEITEGDRRKHRKDLPKRKRSRT